MSKNSKQHAAKKAPKAVPSKKRSKGKPDEVVATTSSPEAEPAEPTAPAPTAADGRDPRLPPVGAVLKRSFKGTEYEVTVLEVGFEFQGKPYKSLSKIAREIAGTSWNGYGFFNLLAKPAKAAKEGQP